MKKDNSEALYIGLMSGTSMDGIDAALVAINGDHCELIASHQHPLPAELVTRLNRLCQQSEDELELMMQASIDVALAFSDATLSLLKKANVQACQVKAIGSHGQTIRHLPPTKSQLGNSLQIGLPAIIAAQTQIDVIADFRVMDMAMGGQGAPLVPAFHQKYFQTSKVNRAIVNVGGIANITWLPAVQTLPVIGFDTGPGNTLLDYWYQQHHTGHYDPNGQWSASGEVDCHLLSAMLNEDYFAQSAPKSTGRELFNDKWLQRHIKDSELSPEDIQATLCKLSAGTIADSLKQLSKDSYFELYLCGGGVHNNQLIHEFKQELPECEIQSTEKLALSPDWVEAVAFAWLAKRHIHREPGNLPAVTGASKEVVLGSFTPA